jgi:alpha-glucosidase (family GH31 glycosyl hydrolase)
MKVPRELYGLGVLLLVHLQQGFLAKSESVDPPHADGRNLQEKTFDPDPGYRLTEIHETSFGLEGTLVKNGKGTATWGPDIQNLSLRICTTSVDTVRVKIFDAEASRWEIPQSLLPTEAACNDNVAGVKDGSLKYKIDYQSDPFLFTISRKDDDAVLFSSASPFVFKDQYIELQTSRSVDAKTFGLGESARTNHALLTNKTYTLWAKDIAALDVHSYGSFPYYVEHRQGKSHGAMLLNRYAVSISLTLCTHTYMQAYTHVHAGIHTHTCKHTDGCIMYHHVRLFCARMTVIICTYDLIVISCTFMLLMWQQRYGR